MSKKRKKQLDESKKKGGFCLLKREVNTVTVSHAGPLCNKTDKAEMCLVFLDGCWQLGTANSLPRGKLRTVGHQPTQQ